VPAVAGVNLLIVASILQEHPNDEGFSLRVSDGIALPPRRFTQLPIKLRTRREASGLCRAAVNAAVAPEPEPAMAQSLESAESLHVLRPRTLFLNHKAGVAIAGTVVFVRSVVFRLMLSALCRRDAGIAENAIV
jgi:hypothetical protein